MLQDDTELIEDDDTGALLGLRNGAVELDITKSLVVAFDVEGTNWKGQSTLENAEGPYDTGVNLLDAAGRYDRKMAGAHWIVYYPDGNLPYKGVSTPCHTIALEILANLQSSGAIAIPMGKPGFDGITKENGWSIELVTAQGSSVDFTNRFGYLDKSKCRALGFPERTVLEGQHGTLAEAGAHQDFVITLIEYRHACILEYVNWHVVNQLLVLNFGEQAENLVTIKAQPLDDMSRSTLIAIYDKIISNPDGYMTEIDHLDMEAIAQSIGIPRKENVDGLNELPQDVPTSSASGVG